MTASGKKRIVIFPTSSRARTFITFAGGLDGPHTINNTRHLQEFVNKLKSSEHGSEYLNSIITVTCPGDDLSALRELYSIAVDQRVLVTTVVIIPENKCAFFGDEAPLSDLELYSDMVVITSDQSYLQYMLECLL